MAADLSRLISPRSIAVVGASDDPRRIGGQPVRALKEFGFTGSVHPVNPRYGTVQGLPCTPDLTSIGAPCDVVLIAVAQPLVPGVIEECRRAGHPVRDRAERGLQEVGRVGRTPRRRSSTRRSSAAACGSSARTASGCSILADRVYAGFGSTFRTPT